MATLVGATPLLNAVRDALFLSATVAVGERSSG